jgi:predicted RNase H-like HicB family nuclease
MKVVEDMAEYLQDDNEPEPSWDDATAAFGTGEPVDLVRPARKIVIEYRYADNRFHATSPNLTGFEVTGPTLEETRNLVQADLDRYLDPAVELDERIPAQIFTAGTGRSRVTHGPRELVTSTASRSCVFVSPSPVRAS